MKTPREICFGPFFVKARGENLEGFDAYNAALEFTSDSHHISPLYRSREEFIMRSYSRGAGGFYIRADQLPCNVSTYRVFTRQIGDITLMPLDDVLLAIYRKFAGARPLREILNELRALIPDPPAEKFPPLNYPNHLIAPLAELGFRTCSTFTYGRRLTVQIEWAPVVDAGRFSPCSLNLAGIDFKPQPDRTLGKAKWFKFRRDLLATLLREDLARVFKGPFNQMFTPEGTAALIAEFPWKPISLLSRKQLEQAKLDFIRQHPELHADTRALAKALIAAGLYSEGSCPSAVRKTAARLVSQLSA